MTGSNQFISFQSFFLLSLCGFIAKSFHAKNPFIFITVFTIFILVDWSASVNEKPRQKCLSQSALILFTHTCPVTEFAVASHLNTANSCCHRVFLRHFWNRKCLPVNSSRGFLWHKECFTWNIFRKKRIHFQTLFLELTHSTSALFIYLPASSRNQSFFTWTLFLFY